MTSKPWLKYSSSPPTLSFETSSPCSPWVLKFPIWRKTIASDIKLSKIFRALFFFKIGTIKMFFPVFLQTIIQFERERNCRSGYPMSQTIAFKCNPCIFLVFFANDAVYIVFFKILCGKCPICEREIVVLVTLWPVVNNPTGGNAGSAKRNLFLCMKNFFA